MHKELNRRNQWLFEALIKHWEDAELRHKYYGELRERGFTDFEIQTTVDRERLPAISY